ncbi:hypothetical protein JHK82_040037 [Glycine max]|nr:hypothetical protein JHK82_040037 [Glycine max]KAG5122108.1 hypothetical protein JHK84_040448 [Glycine max]
MEHLVLLMLKMHQNAKQFLPSYVAATTIGDIFKSHYIEARPSWKKVPLTVRKMWFTEFLTKLNDKPPTLSELFRHTHKRKKDKTKSQAKQLGDTSIVALILHHDLLEKVNPVFDSEEKAFDSYTRYATSHGHVVRKDGVSRDVHGKAIKRMFRVVIFGFPAYHVLAPRSVLLLDAMLTAIFRHHSSFSGCNIARATSFFSTHTKKLPSLIVKKEKIMSKVEGSNYEELRMQRIAENQAKIEALGLSKLTTIFKDRIQKAKKKDKKKANYDDEDYVPEYEGGLGSNSSSENYDKDKLDEFTATNDLESRKRKDAFSLSDEVKEYAMKQIKSQYKNKLYHLHQAYLKEKDRSKFVSREDWNWLIKNKWSGSKFQKEDSKYGKWPYALEVWKATHMRSNGTWCIPKGEEIMKALENVGDIYQEEISKAPIPLVENFAMRGAALVE